MSNVSKGTSYEQFVQEIMQAMLTAQNGSTIKVEHKKKIQGRTPGVEHEIDVYWEFRLGGITHKVAIECKNWNQAVDIGIVREMIGTTTDVPGLRGIIVSQVGFQSGAIGFAQANNIGLKLIRKPVEDGSDYVGNGWASCRKIRIDVCTTSPKLMKVQIHPDPNWVKESNDQAIRTLLKQAQFEGMTDKVFVSWTENESQHRMSILELFDQLPSKSASEEVHIHTYRWDNAWIEVSSEIRIKLHGMDFHYKFLSSEPITIDIDAGDARAVVRDIIDESLLIVEKDGFINGDVEKEGISVSRDLSHHAT